MDQTSAGAPSSSQAIGWEIFDTQVRWPDQFDASKTPGVYELKAGFLAALFRGRVRALRVNGDPNTRRVNAACFETLDGVCQVRVMSAVRPDERYEFNWTFRAPLPGADAGIPCGDAKNRIVQVLRRNGPDASDPANVSWLIAPEKITLPVAPEDMNIGIYCKAIGERITLRLGDFSITYHETAAKREAERQKVQTALAQEILPWRAVLHWMSEVGRIDQAAYGRVPDQIKVYLGPDLSWNATSARIESLRLTDVVGWQHQGVLPAQLPRMEDGYVPELMLSVQWQQRIARRPDVQWVYNEAIWPFSRLVLSLTNLEQLQAVDFQALMTIGALREMRRHFDDLIDEMAKTDPTVKALIEGGLISQLLDKPEFAMLLSDEQVLNEKDDEDDINRRRRQLNYGMSKREFERTQEFRNALAAMQAQFMGNFDYQQGMGQFAALRQYYMSAPPRPGSPPWKIYEPYMV